MADKNHSVKKKVMKEKKPGRWWFRLFVVIVPVAFFVLLELGLRLAGYERELHEFVLVKQYQGEKYCQINPLISRKYFASHNVGVPEPYPDLFKVKKPERTIRIFCLGESTMFGYPYPVNVNAPRFLRHRLAALYPGRELEVINLGIPAVSSSVILDLLRSALDYEPDLIIVYSGHNEFYGTYGVASTEYRGQNRTFLRLYIALRDLRVFGLIRNTVLSIENIFAPTGEPTRHSTFLERMVREREIPLGSKLYEAARRMYTGNIREMIELAKKKGVPIALTTVVSNDRNLPPFISGFDPATPESKRAEWKKLFDEGVSLQAAQRMADALSKFSEAKTIDSGRADVHYRRAQCLWMLDRFDEARQEFIRARDLDVLRFRASSEFNNLLRDESRKNGAFLIDLDSLFAAESPHGVTGSSLIIEHLHPDLFGYFLMGKAYAGCAQAVLHSKFGTLQPVSLPADSAFLGTAPFTSLDTVSAAIRVHILRSGWPFRDNPTGTFSFEPKTGIEQIAFKYCEEELSWDAAHYQVASVDVKAGDIPAAAKEYETVAKELYLYYHPLMMLGDMQARMKDFAAAEQSYRRALELQDVQFVRFRLGVLCSQEGKTAEAIQHLQQALAIDDAARVKMTQDARLMTMYVLGVAYGQSGQEELAIQEMKSILSVDPGHQPAAKFLEQLAGRGG